MSDLVSKGLFDDLIEINEWFSEAKRQLGMSQKADRGRVMATINKLAGEIERMKEEQLLVANYCNYAEWGYIVRAARDSGQETANSIELPEECKTFPTGWVLRDNGMTYGAAKKRLPTTQKLVKEALAHIESVKHEEEEGWAETMKQKLIEKFVSSTDPAELEEELFMFARDVEEEDPETTWVEAADSAAAALEKATDLPVKAVEELIAYAYEQGVEITKQHLGFIEGSAFSTQRWFDYLLANCLRKTNRATEQEVEVIKELKQKALDLWRCYEVVSANDPTRPTLTKKVYAPGVSVEMIDAACREVYRLEEEGGERETDAWSDAVVKAVAATNEGNALVISTEKTS